MERDELKAFRTRLARYRQKAAERLAEAKNIRQANRRVIAELRRSKVKAGIE